MIEGVLRRLANAAQHIVVRIRVILLRQMANCATLLCEKTAQGTYAAFCEGWPYS